MVEDILFPEIVCNSSSLSFCGITALKAWLRLLKLQKYNLIFVHLLRNASGNHRDVQSGHLVSKSIFRLFGKIDFLLLTSSRGQPGGKSDIGSSNCESRKLGWSWNL